MFPSILTEINNKSNNNRNIFSYHMMHARSACNFIKVYKNPFVASLGNRLLQFFGNIFLSRWVNVLPIVSNDSDVDIFFIILSNQYLSIQFAVEKG